MGRMSSRMTKYEAPDGYVYDWVILPEDGNHLYVKYLFLNKNDSIDNYVLVEDPKGENK